jgi:hypothetical protein
MPFAAVSAIAINVVAMNRPAMQGEVALRGTCSDLGATLEPTFDPKS